MTEYYERDLPPAHYTVELSSYSNMFRPEKLESFESGLFEAGSYKWRLFFYPNGDKEDDGEGFISVYLAIANSNLFSDNWSVHVNYRLFLQNQKQNKFLVVEDAEGIVRRFDQNKTRWGFGKFLSLDTLKNPTSGYLVNDSIVFGAEVFVIETTGRKERIYIFKKPPGGTHTWKIPNFSTLDNNVKFSEPYIVDDREWKLRLYPKGNAAGRRGEFLSLHLMLADLNGLPPKRAVFAEFDLLLVDKSRHCDSFKRQYSKWFSTRCDVLGHNEFTSLKDLYKNYLVDDTLIIELQIRSVSAVRLY